MNREEVNNLEYHIFDLLGYDSEMSFNHIDENLRKEKLYNAIIQMLEAYKEDPTPSTEKSLEAITDELNYSTIAISFKSKITIEYLCYGNLNILKKNMFADGNYPRLYGRNKIYKYFDREYINREFNITTEENLLVQLVDRNNIDDYKKLRGLYAQIEIIEKLKK